MTRPEQSADDVRESGKWCDHRTEALGDTIEATCLCDMGQCYEPAAAWRWQHGLYVHLCAAHIDGNEGA